MIYLYCLIWNAIDITTTVYLVEKCGYSSWLYLLMILLLTHPYSGENK